MGHRNIVVAIVLAALAAAYAILAAGLPERAVPNTPGPAFFPWLITAAIVGLSAALLWQGMRAARGVPLRLDLNQIDRRAVLTLAVFALYLAMLPYAGFLLASVPFTAALIWLYGGRKPLLVAAGSLGMPVLLFYLFREIFSILLPAGLLGG